MKFIAATTISEASKNHAFPPISHSLSLNNLPEVLTSILQSMKSNRNLPRRLQHNIRMQPGLHAIHPILHRLKSLEEPHERISHLRERKLLTDADPRAAVEGDVLP